MAELMIESTLPELGHILFVYEASDAKPVALMLAPASGKLA